VGVGQAGGQQPIQIGLGGFTPEGAPIIDLRLTVDVRTNSLIVAGNPNDLDVIEAIIARLDDSGVEERRNQAYRLINAQAADVAAVINDYWPKVIAAYRAGTEQTPFQELQRDVVLVPDPISNTLLINATPRYLAEIMHMVQTLDYMPPQVLIQVLIA